MGSAASKICAESKSKTKTTDEEEDALLRVNVRAWADALPLRPPQTTIFGCAPFTTSALSSQQYVRLDPDEPIEPYEPCANGQMTWTGMLERCPTATQRRDGTPESPGPVNPF
jgi:hypothetical protein